MEPKYIPFEKLSKKKKQELNRKRRGTWGALNPVTRRPKKPKAYDRQKARRSSREDCDGVLFYSFYSRSQSSITRTTRSVAWPSQAEVCSWR